MGLMACILVAMNYCVCTWITACHDDIAAANQNRVELLSLANELRDSSNELTRMARSYVATGDPKFKKCFQLVQAFRSGQANRPEDYSKNYWDLKLADEAADFDTVDSPGVSLLQRLRKAGVTDAEERVFRLSQDNSTKLVATESIAMAMVDRAPNDPHTRLKAIELLFSPEYHKEKAQIMNPIVQFNLMLDKRTETRIHHLEDKGYRLLALGRILLFGTIALLVVSTVINEHMVTKPAMAALRLQADSEAEAKRFAQLASETKSQILANVSHEIRTPMNAIMGMTNVLSATELDATQDECVSMLSSSSEMLLALLNDMLDYSKIDAGRLELNLIPTSLRNTIRDVILVQSVEAATKQIDLDWSVDNDVPDSLMLDPLRLQQILLNLISNAIKFTHEGQVEVVVAADQQEPTDGPSDSSDRDFTPVSLVFSIRDSGIGIPADKLTAIFSPFTQADQSTYHSYGGTGLGLTIATKLAQLMDGALTVESTEGVGSTFRLRFAAIPCRPEEVIDLESQRNGTPNLTPSQLKNLNRPLSLLVFEDNPMNQLALKKLVQPFNCHLKMATSAADGIALYKQNTYDAVLMDVQLPDMDGFAATEEIRRHENAHGSLHTPVIAVTADTLPETQSRCLAAGMDAFVTKPIRPNQFLDTLIQLTDDSLESLPTDQLKSEPTSAEHADVEHADADVGKADVYFDEALALQQCENDPEYLGDLIDIFLKHKEQLEQQLQGAWKARNAELLHRSAHTLNNNGRTLCSQRVHEIAAELETLTYSDMNDEKIQQLVPKLLDAVDTLHARLVKWKQR